MRTLRFREISKCPGSQWMTGLGSRVHQTPNTGFFTLRSALSLSCITFHINSGISCDTTPFMLLLGRRHTKMSWALTVSKPRIQCLYASYIPMEDECQRSLASVHLEVKLSFAPSGAQRAHFHACCVCVHGGGFLSFTRHLIMNNFMFPAFLKLLGSGWLVVFSG